MHSLRAPLAGKEGMEMSNCDHENVKKVKSVRDATTPGIHTGEMGEIWEVECESCHEQLEYFYSNH